MSLSNDTENAVLACLLKGTDPSYRSGATQYLALFTADPGETASLTLLGRADDVLAPEGPTPSPTLRLWTPARSSRPP